MAKGFTAPFGDIYYVGTPALDRWGQQLYAEQKMREARAMQEGAALDANIQKEIGKVRSVDTPDVINSYQQYKQYKKELLFNKSLQKDPVAYNQMQQKAAQAYQNIFTKANRSAEVNDMQKGLTSSWMKNPNEHVENFGAKMNMLMNTPISQLTPDMTDVSQYMDTGINTDFGKMVKEGVGQSRTIYGKPETLPGGLQTRTPAYLYANTPSQVKDYLIGAMAMRQSGRDAAKAWDRLPQEEIDNVIKQYQAIPADYWQKIGLQGPQDLMPKNPDNKAENFASYLAMKDAVARLPQEGKPVVTQNLAALEDLKFNRQKQLEAIKQANREDLIRLRKSLNPSDQEINNVWYQSYLDKLTSEANASGERHYIVDTKTGKQYYNYNMVKPDPFIAKAFTRGKSEPDRIGVTPSGDIIPVFFKYNKDGSLVTDKDKRPIIDEDYTKPMSYEQALVNLGYRGATKKELGKQMQHLHAAPTTNINDLRKKYNY